LSQTAVLFSPFLAQFTPNWFRGTLVHLNYEWAFNSKRILFQLYGLFKVQKKYTVQVCDARMFNRNIKAGFIKKNNIYG